MRADLLKYFEDRHLWVGVDLLEERRRLEESIVTAQPKLGHVATVRSGALMECARGGGVGVMDGGVALGRRCDRHVNSNVTKAHLTHRCIHIWAHVRIVDRSRCGGATKVVEVVKVITTE